MTHWGPSLLRKVGAEAFARDPEQWRRHCESSHKAIEQFSKIFGDEFKDGASKAAAKKGSKKGGGDESGQRGGRDEADGPSVPPPMSEEAAPAAAKGAKKRKAVDAVPSAGAASVDVIMSEVFGLPDAAEDGSLKKDKRKRKKNCS